MDAVYYFSTLRGCNKVRNEGCPPSWPLMLQNLLYCNNSEHKSVDLAKNTYIQTILKNWVKWQPKKHKELLCWADKKKWVLGYVNMKHQHSFLNKSKYRKLYIHFLNMQPQLRNLRLDVRKLLNRKSWFGSKKVSKIHCSNLHLTIEPKTAFVEQNIRTYKEHIDELND